MHSALALAVGCAGMAGGCGSGGPRRAQLVDGAPGTSTPLALKSVANTSGSNRLALRGYDPVAYFDSGRAERGLQSISAQADGLTYRFANASHRDIFVANPSRFQPAYGGWCASAMADHGGLVDADPENYEVRDGRLFVFFKFLFIDAKGSWVSDPQASLRRADKNWFDRTGLPMPMPMPMPMPVPVNVPLTEQAPASQPPTSGVQSSRHESLASTAEGPSATSLALGRSEVGM